MKHKFKVVLRVEQLEDRSTPAIAMYDLSLTSSLPTRQDLLSVSLTNSPITNASALQLSKRLESAVALSETLQQRDSMVQNPNLLKADSQQSNTRQQTNQLFSILNTALPVSQSSDNEEILDPSFAVYPAPSLPSIIVYAGTTTIPEIDEQGEGKPGWYLPVNWGDVDDDGWSPSKAAAPKANGGPVYSGDLTDDYIPGPKPHNTGGSNALFKFEVSANLIPMGPNKDGNVKLTFDTTKIKVWSTNTKKLGDVNSPSSEVTSGKVYNWINDMLPNGGKVTLYAEGITGSSSFKDAFLKAELINVVNAQPPGAPDDVQVTAFEVTTQGKYGPGDKSTDNDFDFSDDEWLKSSNKLGIISYETDAKCEWFHNCMEMQGTVKPAVVDDVDWPYGFGIGPYEPLYIVGFNAYRWMYTSAWGRLPDNTWTAAPVPGGKPLEWVDDSSTEEDNDRSVSAQSHIYFSDGPGIAGENQTNGVKEIRQYFDFRNIFSGHIYDGEYQISNFAKWHSQTFVIANPADPTKFILDAANNQKLGDGWIDIPTAAP